MEKEIDQRMHTAEHIINQAMVRKFGTGRCFSAHIEKKKSKLDYKINKTIKEADIRELEKDINDVVSAHLEVVEVFLDYEIADKQFDLGKIPEEKKSKKIRIIKVGDYDACPCIGPHVANTKEIGKVAIKTFSISDGVLRIRYKLE